MCRGCRKVVKSGWQVVRPTDALPANRTWQPSRSHGTYQHEAITWRSRQFLMMGTWLPETCWATIRREIKDTKSDISWFFLSTLYFWLSIMMFTVVPNSARMLQTYRNFPPNWIIGVIEVYKDSAHFILIIYRVFVECRTYHQHVICPTLIISDSFFYMWI
jgi:hypothetical protein